MNTRDEVRQMRIPYQSQIFADSTVSVDLLLPAKYHTNPRKCSLIRYPLRKVSFYPRAKIRRGPAGEKTKKYLQQTC